MLLGNGAGTLQNPVSYAVGANSYGVVAEFGEPVGVTLPRS